MTVVERRASSHDVQRDVVVRIGDVEHREVVAGDNRLHPRHRLGRTGVDRRDASMRMGRLHVGGMQLAGQVQVSGEAGFADDLVVAVMTNRTGPDPGVPLRLGHGRILGCRHDDAPFNWTAASCTERTILS